MTLTTSSSDLCQGGRWHDAYSAPPQWNKQQNSLSPGEVEEHTTAIRRRRKLAAMLRSTVSSVTVYFAWSSRLYGRRVEA